MSAMEVMAARVEEGPVGADERPAPVLLRVMLPVALVAATVAAHWPGLRGEFLDWDDFVDIVENEHIRALTWENARWAVTQAHNGDWEPLTWLATAVQYRLWALRSGGYHAVSVGVHIVNVLLVYWLAAALVGESSYIKARRHEGTEARREGRELQRAPEYQGEGFAARSEEEDKARRHDGTEARREGRELQRAPEYQGEGFAARSMSAIWIGAGVGAAVFALHPLRVEGVAWVSAQAHPLAAMLGLLATLAYVRYAQRGGQGGVPGRGEDQVRGGRGWPVQATMLLAMATLVKATGLALPAVWLLLDVYPLRRRAKCSWGRLIAEKVPALLWAAAMAVVVNYARRQHEVVVSLAEFGVWERAAQASWAVWFHLLKTAVPTGLMPIYPYLLRFDAWSWPFVAAVGAMVLASVAAVASARRQPGAWVAWFAWLLLLLPFLGLSNHPHYPSDRYTYLASVVIAVVVAGVVAWCRERVGRGGRAALVALALVVVAALGVMTWRQSAVWTRSVSLFQHILRFEHEPSRRAVMLVRLGMAHEREADAARAYEAYRSADLLRPGEEETLLRMGAALVELNRLGEAADRYRQVLAARPESARAAVQLAGIRFEQEQYAEAERLLRGVLRRAPQHQRARRLLADTLFRAERLEECVEVYEELLEHRPDQAEAWANLALAQWRLGRVEAARETSRRALQLSEARGMTELIGQMQRMREETREAPVSAPASAPAR